MKKQKSKKISLTVFAILVISLIGTIGIASAYRGDINEQGPNFDSDIHDQMVGVFENYDYNTWKGLMEENRHEVRILEVINKDNFQTFADSHNAALEGDFETANRLREELNLHNGANPKYGTGRMIKSQGKYLEKGKGHSMNHQNQFIDKNNDGLCDNSI